MSLAKAVKTLNADLSRLRHGKTAEKNGAAQVTRAGNDEKAALQNITAQEKSIIDAFQQTSTTPMDPATQQKLLSQLFGLGEKEVQTQDKFAASIAADKSALAREKKAVTADHKRALADLKPAEYHLSLKATNVDRKELGLQALKKPLRQTGTTGSPFKPGPGTLRGEDTSHWTSQAGFLQSIQGKQWSAIESSNGTSGVDPTFKSRWNTLGQRIKDGKMKLRVAYHFMSAGDGVGQAKHFLDTVGVHGKLPAGTRLCLDFEGSALSDPGALRDASNYIHKVTGTWPMVYVQGSALSEARSAAPHAPIWEASWSAADGSNGGDGNDNRSVAFFQYAGDVASGGDRHDFDDFNGNLKALERFAGWS